MAHKAKIVFTVRLNLICTFDGDVTPNEAKRLEDESYGEGDTIVAANHLKLETTTEKLAEFVNDKLQQTAIRNLNLPSVFTEQGATLEIDEVEVDGYDVDEVEVSDENPGGNDSNDDRTYDDDKDDA